MAIPSAPTAAPLSERPHSPSSGRSVLRSVLFLHNPLPLPCSHALSQTSAHMLSPPALLASLPHIPAGFPHTYFSVPLQVHAPFVLPSPALIPLFHFLPILPVSLPGSPVAPNSLPSASTLLGCSLSLFEVLLSLFPQTFLPDFALLPLFLQASLSGFALLPLFLQASLYDFSLRSLFSQVPLSGSALLPLFSQASPSGFSLLSLFSQASPSGFSLLSPFSQASLSGSALLSPFSQASPSGSALPSLFL